MTNNLKYLSEERELRILNVFIDQKLKYNLDELPGSKIQGLTSINYFTLLECLAELEKSKKIARRTVGNKVYWKLL